MTTGQILLFGLTGGLIPCPAAITVLLLCLQLKQITLGVILVLFFSVGLAVTMVSAGVLASLSVKHISKRWSGFSRFARRAPYASGGLMVIIALVVAHYHRAPATVLFDTAGTTADRPVRRLHLLPAARRTPVDLGRVPPNGDSGALAVDSEYLEVVATRR